MPDARLEAAFSTWLVRDLDRSSIGSLEVFSVGTTSTIVVSSVVRRALDDARLVGFTYLDCPVR